MSTEVHEVKPVLVLLWKEVVADIFRLVKRTFFMVATVMLSAYVIGWTVTMGKSVLGDSVQLGGIFIAGAIFGCITMAIFEATFGD